MPSRLKEAMQLRKLTVADLVSRTGMSKAALYFLLDGTSAPEGVKYSTVQGLCRALRISPEWLMTGVGGMEPQRASQAVGIDADTIRDAQEALAAIARIQGVAAANRAEWVNEAERLALAINTVLSVQSEATQSNVIDLMARIAARMRSGEGNAVKQGTDGKGSSTA